jgi:hypothetical protein
MSNREQDERSEARPVPAILTDERIHDILNTLDVAWWDVPESATVKFARAIEAELAAVPGKGQAVAYADPAAFANFKAGTATNEWMWAKPDAGLVPLYTHPSPVSMPVAAAGVAYQIKQHGWASMWMDASKAEYDACDTEKRCFPAAPVAVDRNAARFSDRDQMKPAEQQGLFEKFRVQRLDGSDCGGGKHYGCRYFVLDLTHDQHAPAAMRAYAASCALTHPQLSADLVAEFGALQQSADKPAEA